MFPFRSNPRGLIFPVVSCILSKPALHTSKITILIEMKLSDRGMAIKIKYLVIIASVILIISEFNEYFCIILGGP